MTKIFAEGNQTATSPSVWAGSCVSIRECETSAPAVGMGEDRYSILCKCTFPSVWSKCQMCVNQPAISLRGYRLQAEADPPNQPNMSPFLKHSPSRDLTPSQG